MVYKDPLYDAVNNPTPAPPPKPINYDTTDPDFDNAEKVRQRAESDLGSFKTDELERAAKYLEAQKYSGLPKQVGIGGFVTGAENLRTELARRNLQSEKNNLATKRKERLQGLTERETQLREQLMGIPAQVEQAVGAQLNNLLQEAGIAGGALRAQTGEVYAARGLSRSTFAQQGVDEITGRELEQKASARLAASEQIGGARRAVGQTLESLDEAKKRSQAAIEAGKEASLDEMLFGLEKEKVNRHFQEMIAQGKMDSARAAGLEGLLGEFAGGAALLAFL